MTRKKLPEEYGRPGRPPGVHHSWTLDKIRERCGADDDEECWEDYTGMHGQRPTREHQKCFPSVMHEGKRILLRRLAYRLAFPDKPLDGLFLVMSKCNNTRCQNPHHAKTMTESQKCARAADRGSFGGVVRCMKIAATKQAQGKLDWGKVAAIRADTTPAKQGPWKKYGISETMWKRIRANRSWRVIDNPLARMAA